MTTKRIIEAEKSFSHQYAIGQTLTLNIGYVFSIGKRGNGLGLEGHLEASSRTVTVDEVGDRTFRSGQAGGNVYYTF